MGRTLVQVWRHPLLTAALLFVAGAFFVAWKFNVVPYATEWGDLGTWVSAVFTGGGLIFAGLSAKSAAGSVRAQTEQRKEQERARKRDEEERRTAMAHSVSVSSWWAKDWEDRWCVCYRVANKSPYPVSQVTVRAWDTLGEDKWSHEAYEHTYKKPEYDVFLERVLGTLLPDDELAESVRIYHPMAGPRPIIPVDPVAVLFTDVWGKHWIRTDSTTIETDGAACMCQSCQESIPEDRIWTIPDASPVRNMKVGSPTATSILRTGITWIRGKESPRPGR